MLHRFHQTIRAFFHKDSDNLNNIFLFRQIRLSSYSLSFSFAPEKDNGVDVYKS